MKIDLIFGKVDPKAAELINRHGGKITETDFFQLPSGVNFTDFYDGGAGVSDTTICRNFEFAGHTIKMCVSDGGTGQLCTLLEVVK